HFAALSRDGKLLWERSLVEEFGLVTTHGGRTVSPVIEGELVITSGVTTGWGAQSRALHRFLAFDKKTGLAIWVSSPGGRPFDTTYAPPVVSLIDGVRLFISGGGDGAIHALKIWTGEPAWKFEMAKRGINTGVVVNGSTAIVSHSEENLDSSEMGLLAALDAGSRGPIPASQVKWAVKGFQGGFSSAVLDGGRLYQIDNGANLFAFDAATGKELWRQNLGTIQKASPVFGDGKLYVGTENGKFFILRPGASRAEILDEDSLEPIIGSAAISDGRLFVASTEALYCIGKKSVTKAAPPGAPVASGGPPAHLQVTPTELILKPGERVRFHARLFDPKGNFLREEPAAWTLEQLRGTIQPDGEYRASDDPVAQAGQVKASAGSLQGAARVRVIPPLPVSETFDGGLPAHWINAAGKFAARDLEGNKILVKLADNPFTKRARAFLGAPEWSDYTVEADVRALEKRRQMGDGGVVAGRYSLVLFGNHQRLELQSWQPETERTVTAAFAWKPDVWYRLKLRVDNLPGGGVRVRGKAWPASDPEPSAWTLERTDAIGNRQGSPGLYADAPFEVYFDNLKVTRNQ
ncbi:MAG: hypothetical protein FJW37_05835, partial [Acidobacteria bacterium]|nr:hypothetical protein [Acidobacteriota bacterium]